MKTLLTILLILLAPSLAFSGTVLSGGVLSGTACGGAGSTCSAASNEIGNRTAEATNSTISKAYSVAALYAADCTGTLNTAYFYHNDTADGNNIKIGVYLDDGDGIPDSGDTQVAVSAALDITTSKDWYSVLLGSGNVTNGSSYWIVVMFENAGPASTNTARSTSGSARFSLESSGHYASPPATLDATWTSIGAGSWSWYVTIGD